MRADAAVASARRPGAPPTAGGVADMATRPASAAAPPPRTPTGSRPLLKPTRPPAMAARRACMARRVAGGKRGKGTRRGRGGAGAGGAGGRERRGKRRQQRAADAGLRGGREDGGDTARDTKPPSQHPPAVAAQQQWESLGKRIAGRGWRGCLRRTRGGPSGSRLRCGREPTPAASGDWPDGHRRRGAEPPDVACAPAVVGCGARSAAMNLPVTWHGQPPSRGRGGCTRRYGSGEVGFL